MMQVNLTKRIHLIFLALLLLALLGCSTQDANAVFFGKLSDDPFEGAYYITSDGKAIAPSFNEDEWTFFLNDFQNGKRSVIGTIPNFYLCTSSSAYVDETVYLFQCVSEENQPKNVFYGIDLKNNTLKELNYNDDESVAGLSVYRFGENQIVSLKNIRYEDDSIKTFIDCYDCDSGTWTQEHEMLFRSYSEPGAAISAFYADKDYLYLLVDEYDADDETPAVTKLVQYNTSMEPVNSWVLEGEILDFIMGEYRITQMFVQDGFVYLKNVSSYGYLGKIEADGTVRTIGQREQWIIGNTANPGEDKFALFFDRNGNTIDQLDYETGSLKKIALTGGLEILDVWIHADRIFIHSLNREEKNATAVYGTYQAVLDQFAEKTE